MTKDSVGGLCQESDITQESFKKERDQRVSGMVAVRRSWTLHWVRQRGVRPDQMGPARGRGSKKSWGGTMVGGLSTQQGAATCHLAIGS